MLAFCACAVQWTLSAFPARQVLQISYYDDDKITTQMPKTPNFMRSRRDVGVDRGVMALYEYTILDVLGAVSLHVGGNVGRWERGSEQLVTGSAFLSGRLWVLHLLFLHPYFEYSLLGPTIASRDNFADMKFKSNILFQNFFGVGMDIGESRGFSIDIKTIRYYESDNFHPQDGFRVPIIASVGVIF